MGRHEKTNHDTSGQSILTPQQETAVDLLCTGKTVTDTAKACGVARQTVSEWLHHHSGFQDACIRRRRELWEELTDRLRSLLPKAIDVVEQELTGESPLPAAVHVLKACGLYGVPAPTVKDRWEEFLDAWGTAGKASSARHRPNSGGRGPLSGEIVASRANCVRVSVMLARSQALPSARCPRR